MHDELLGNTGIGVDQTQSFLGAQADVYLFGKDGAERLLYLLRDPMKWLHLRWRHRSFDAPARVAVALLVGGLSFELGNAFAQLGQLLDDAYVGPW